MATTQSSKRCSRRGIRIRGNLCVFKCREYVIAEELSIRDTFTQWRRQEILRRTANKPRPELARAPGTCGSARRRVRGIATQGDGLEHWTEAPVHWCSHRFSHVLFVHSLLGKACFQEARTKMGKSSNTPVSREVHCTIRYPERRCWRQHPEGVFHTAVFPPKFEFMNWPMIASRMSLGVSINARPAALHTRCP